MIACDGDSKTETEIAHKEDDVCDGPVIHRYYDQCRQVTRIEPFFTRTGTQNVQQCSNGIEIWVQDTP